MRLAILATLPNNEVLAQGITVDGRLSPAQTLAGPNFAIGAGLGRQVGGNLFHSFGAFGLKQGETATFSGPNSVGNVIGRVTGGTASSINGGIKSIIPGANLYLINPAGVVLGPKASVDVSGSFHASSADYLRMKDGARFQAANPDVSTLSAAPPEAFGFLSATPQPVMVNGSNLHQLAPGSTLGLVGGTVTISNGALAAPSGTVHIASAAGPGEVPVDPRAGPATTVARSGRVQVAGTTIAASGDTGSVFIRAGELSVSASTIGADNSGAGPGGVLSLHGDQAVAVSNRTTIRATATGTGRGPGVSIGTAASGRVTLDGATVNSTATATGAGGTVAISTGTLTLRNGAVVLSRTTGLGAGGPITAAADSVLLDGSGTALLSVTSGAGLADANGVSARAGASGAIALTGGQLTVQNKAAIEANTFGSGPGGSISAAMTGNVSVAGGSQILSSSNASGAPSLAAAEKGGDSGPITLDAGALALTRGGSVKSATFAFGNAGKVALNVAGALTIDATDFGGSPNGVSSETADTSSGSAGTVLVSAGSVSVLNGGFINGNTHGTGAAGSVVVTTPGALLLDGGGVGGGSTEIGASALGTQSGNAGPVTVSAGRVTVQNGAQIASNAYGPGRGGDVMVATPGVLLLDGQGVGGTGITAGTRRAQSGDAGTVTVNAGSVAVQRGAQIASNTDGPGRASGVTVNAGTLTLSRGGAIRSVASASGNAGEVALNVAGAVTIDATDFGRFPNGVSSETTQNSSGSANTVRVAAGSVSVLNGGFINGNTRGTGAGGSVVVATPGALLLDDGGVGGGNTEIGASALGLQSGTAGMITISAGRVTVQNGAQIASSTDGPGRGGDVTVNTGSISILNGGIIGSDTGGTGSAGSVQVATPGALLLDGRRGTAAATSTGILAQALGAQSGNGGTITVRAGSVSILNGGVISSGNEGAGSAGLVQVTTPGVLLVDGRRAPSIFTGITAVTAGARSGNAGAVTISAGTATIQGGAQITSSTDGPGRGGDVTINTSALLLDGQGLGGTAISAETLGPGPRSGEAGTVTINAGSTAVQGRAQISSSTAGAGRGGDVTVNTGALTVSGGSNVISVSAAAASGNAGIVALNVAGALTVDAAQAGRFTNGVSSEARPGSFGAAGTVQVNAGSVSVLNGGFINSSAGGTGRGGSVMITTPGALVLDGRGQVGGPAEVSASATRPQSGDAGSVTIRAGSVSVLNSGVITSNTQGTGRGGSVLVETPGALLLDGRGDTATAISAETLGLQSGDAGTVTVSAGTVTIQGGAQIASNTTGPGRGGNVDVTAGSAINLNGPGPQVAGTATGTGNAGSITVSAPQLFLRDGAGISTAAQAANGGNITIGAGDLLYLQHSSITTSVNSAFGNGGNITVDPRLVVLDRSLIQANAVGGEGGNVLVRADQLVQSAGSAITATSQLGVSGQIFITGPPLDLNGSLVVLASDLRSAAALLREGCAVRGASPRSSLIAAGRGGQRQGLEATLPALYFAHRPVRDGTAPVAASPAASQRVSLGLSSLCG